MNKTCSKNESQTQQSIKQFDKGDVNLACKLFLRIFITGPISEATCKYHNLIYPMQNSVMCFLHKEMVLLFVCFGHQTSYPSFVCCRKVQILYIDKLGIISIFSIILTSIELATLKTRSFKELFSAAHCSFLLHFFPCVFFSNIIHLSYSLRVLRKRKYWCWKFWKRRFFSTFWFW